MGIPYYDTNALIELQEQAFNSNFIISSKTLEEIEFIKCSETKSEELKYKIRKLSHLLNDNADKYDVSIVTLDNYDILNEFNLPVTPDNLIISGCYILHKENKDVVFVSNDINCRIIANKIFGLKVESLKHEEKDEYTGYKEINLSNEEIKEFNTHLDSNIYDCLINQYLIVKNTNDNSIEKYKWDGNSYIPVKSKSFKSKIFGDIRALDEIQICAFDSIINNDITLLYGKAGSGKTTIPLAYMMHGLEYLKIRKCYIVYHYETLKKAKTLGFERGTHEDKLLNSGSLGNILSSKFTDYKYITSLLGDKIEIIPTANIRGVEFGADDVVFVTESQNIDPYTIKTIIQRCKSGCKQIYEGDMLEQSDINMGISGMKRVIDVFKGYNNFGCIKLKYNYRSEICELADKI